jgi:hypothetical protein
MGEDDTATGFALSKTTENREREIINPRFGCVILAPDPMRDSPNPARALSSPMPASTRASPNASPPCPLQRGKQQPALPSCYQPNTSVRRQQRSGTFLQRE